LVDEASWLPMLLTVPLALTLDVGARLAKLVKSRLRAGRRLISCAVMAVLLPSRSTRLVKLLPDTTTSCNCAVASLS
jgi:hypothetical protein